MLTPNIPNIRILNAEEPHPEGYVTSDGKWAAVPWGKNKYVIICNGEQVHTSSSFYLAKDYILKKVKQTPRNRKSSSTLEEYL
jgi:hypothetical protein